MATRRRSANLGSPPDRTAGLGPIGLAPPVPAQQVAPVIEEQPAVAATVEPAAAPEPAKPRPPKKTPAARAQQADDGKPVATRIPVSLLDGITEAKALTGETHEQWFIRALKATWLQVGELYQRPAEETPEGVPDIPDMPRARRAPGERLGQYSLRLLPAQRTILQDRFAELRPTSMSELVTAIVRCQLDRERATSQS